MAQRGTARLAPGDRGCLDQRRSPPIESLWPIAVPEEVADLISRRSSRTRGPSRAAILDASRRLYATSDYSGVTMRAVAKAVGCRSPSLYHYFKSKDDIFRALVDHGVALFEQFMPSIASDDPLDQLWWRFWRYYEFSKAHPEYFRLLFIDRSSPVGDENLHARVLGGADTHRWIEASVRAGLLPPDTDPVESAVVLWSTVHGAAVLGMRRQRPAVGRDVLAVRSLCLALDAVRLGLLKSPSPWSLGRLADVDKALGSLAKEYQTDPHGISLRTRAANSESLTGS